jgi:DNA polymerase III gamma/tau subunit
LCDAIISKDAASALRKVRELHSRGANLESLGRDLLEALRNIAVAKLPSNDSMTPLADLPDHEAIELKRLADRASNRDVMRLFRLMAEAQEELLKSPYPDLLMEMAVIRMAALVPVMDADELLRAIGNGGGAGPASSSSGSSGAASSASSGGPSGSVATRRMKVEGEVNATAPVRAPSPSAPRPTAPLGAGIAQGSIKPDLPELRDFIRTRRAALAGFMEQGASLALNDDVLTVNARNDIYIRYLSDNRATIAELAGEFFARPIKVEVSSNGTVVSTATAKAPAASASSSNGAAQPAAPEVSPVEKAAPPEIEPKLTVVRDTPPAAAQAPSAPPPAVDATVKSRAGGPEDRQAVLQDPEMRRIFDELEARLVEVRITPDTEAVTEPVIQPVIQKDADAPTKN